MVGGFMEALNWNRMSTPFIAGFSAVTRGRDTGQGRVIPALACASAVCGLIAVWYLMYRFISFPPWMAWFN